MRTIEISMIVDEKLKKTSLICDRNNRTLIFSMPDNVRKVYKAHDIYECFGLLRADFPDIKFLCKGAKINVYPSRMSSQMSAGTLAYEVTIGEPARKTDIVHIFDYEDSDITSDIEDQRIFHRKWIESL